MNARVCKKLNEIELESPYFVKSLTIEEAGFIYFFPVKDTLLILSSLWSFSDDSEGA